MIYLFIIIIIILLIIYAKHKFSYWKLKNIPYLSPEFPYGNVKLLLLSKKSVGLTIYEIHKKFQQMNTKYGGFYMLTTPALIITDTDLIKTILIKDFNYFQDRNVYSNIKNDPLSGHLFAAEGSKWRLLRHKISPIFSSGKIKIMFPVILKLSQDLTQNIEILINNNKSIDIKQVLSKFSLDVITTCVFGIKVNSQSKFLEYINIFIKSNIMNNFKMAFGMLYIDFLRFLNIKTMSKEMSKFFINIFTETLKERQKINEAKNDFIDLFIQIKNNNSDISFNDLVAQAFLFFVAGFETNSQTLVYCLYELSLNKNIQQKLRNEIIKIIDNLNYETISSMEYLDQVIRETLRKYPAAPVLNRKCTKSYQIPNSKAIIEKGTPIWISILGIHKDPKYFENPETFNPDRFTKFQKYYLPFGQGPRNCIGMRFGLMQIKIALISLLINFKFTIDFNKTKVPIEFATTGILLNSKEEIFLNVIKI